MALGAGERKILHEIVRFEVRRELHGICCPECGQKAMSASEFDREFGRNTEYSCAECEFSAPLSEYANAVKRYE